MKPGWKQVGLMDDLFHINDGRMTPEDHDACWERYLEVRETIAWKRQEIHGAWVDRQETERARRVELINKARSVIRSLESQIDHCEDLLRNAKSSDFESRVQGWIDEKEAKIRDIEESIQRHE